MTAIFKKEFFSFFSSLTAYVTIGLFLIVNALMLWVFPDTSILEYGYAGLESFFNTAPYIFMFLIPAITMRSISEERRDGTFELLATRPLTDWQILFGKFMAAMAIVVISLLLTLFYYFTVYQLGLPRGNIDSGAVAGSYIGLILLSGAFVAVGLFASAIGRNQVVSFTISVFFCYIFYTGLDSASRIFALRQFDSEVMWLGIQFHYQSISRGLVDSRDVVYFLSFTVLFLLITKIILGSRKW